MLSNCESTTSQYYVMYGAGAVLFFDPAKKCQRAGSGSTKRLERQAISTIQLQSHKFITLQLEI